MRLHLVRRRSLWLPTLPGALLLAAGSFVLLWLGTSSVYDFLALDAPLGSGLLVVEGWVADTAMDDALARYRRGGYQRLVTTGGPIERWSQLLGFDTFAEAAGQLARAKGLPASELAVVPAPASAQDRTFLSAVMVREWARREGLEVRTLDVYSAGPHARRSRWLYQQAFGRGVRVGVIAGPPAGYDPARWWRSSAGVKSVLMEAISWGWTLCCFHPGSPGSWQEKWGPAAARQTESRSPQASRSGRVYHQAQAMKTACRGSRAQLSRALPEPGVPSARPMLRVAMVTLAGKTAISRAIRPQAASTRTRGSRT